MKYRFVVVGIIQNKKGEYLICKKPQGEGVFPGEWALPGGGIDEKETMIEAFEREMKEEVGLEVFDIEPMYFRDDVQEKYKKGTKIDDVYMVYLMFRAKYKGKVRIDNREFENFEWVKPKDLYKYDLNEATEMTFERMGFIKKGRNIYKEWVKYPNGMIPKGAFCWDCKRFNVRNTTVQIIALKNNKVLMQKRKLNPKKGWWALVAGYVGWGETMEESMRRELLEEVGLVAKKLELVGVYSNPDRDADGRENIAIVFAGKVEGKISIDTYEIDEAKWFDLDKLPKNVAFDHREMIGDYLRKNNG